MNRTKYDLIEALNFSNAKRLLISGKAFKEGKEEKEPSEPQIVGTMVHAMVLEGKDLRTTYVIKPKGMKFSTNAGKAWRDSQKLPILENESAESIPRMADAIARHKLARTFIRACQIREHHLVASIAGIKCKGLIDMIGMDTEGRSGFAELKTVADIRKESWRRCVHDFHYDMQVEWYCELLRQTMNRYAPPGSDPELRRQIDSERPWSVWICVENHAPFDVVVRAPSELMIRSGIAKMRDAIETYSACEKSGEWPGLNETSIELIDPPSYRLREIETDE